MRAHECQGSRHLDEALSQLSSITACFAAIVFILVRATELHFVTSISVALCGSRRDLDGVIVVPYIDHTRSMVHDEGTIANTVLAAFAKFGNVLEPYSFHQFGTRLSS